MPGHHTELAKVYTEYLDKFADDPLAAQDILLAKYGDKLVEMTEATKQLGNTPAVAKGLPAGCTLEGTYVLNMPCCTCVQSICRRADGQMLAIFEHNEEQPE